MSKFAIRLLSLAMYATSLPVISMMTSDQAETSSTKHTKKQHRNIQWSRGFSDPRSANAWIVTGPSSQAGPVCPATPEASIAGSFLLQLMKIPIENGPAVAGDAARGRKLGMTRPQKITFGEMRESGARGVLITVLSVLLIATLTIQTATAAARNARKSARAPVSATQQIRERDGISAPAAVQSRSCDRLWCYEDGAAVSASRK